MEQKKYEELARRIPELVGGKENVTFLTYCMTRLRFTMKDKNLVDVEEIKKLPGVLGCQWSGEQLQVIIGQSVGDAYQLVQNEFGMNEEDCTDKKEVSQVSDDRKKGFSLIVILENIAGCLTPLLPVLIGSGLLKIVILLAEMSGFLSTGSSTYAVLTFASDAGFYFLPVFVGGTSAKKFGGNLGLGMLMGAIFIHPSFIQMVTDGTALSVFALPVYGASYASTVFPAILTVWIMSMVEKFIGRHSPDALRSILEPLLTLLIMIPLALCLLGPAGAFIGTYLSKGIMGLYGVTGFFGVAVLSCLMPWIIMTGMHHAFTLHALNSMATLGYETIIATAMIISNINQGAASAAVALKSKNKDLKTMAASCAVTAVFGGVTEPAMYGVNFKLRTPMYGAMIGSFAGAAVAGFGKAYAYTMTSSLGIFSLPIYICDHMSNLYWMIAGVLVGFIVTFISTCMIYRPEEN